MSYDPLIVSPPLFWLLLGNALRIYFRILLNIYYKYWQNIVINSAKNLKFCANWLVVKHRKGLSELKKEAMVLGNGISWQDFHKQIILFFFILFLIFKNRSVHLYRVDFLYDKHDVVETKHTISLAFEFVSLYINCYCQGFWENTYRLFCYIIWKYQWDEFEIWRLFHV